MPTPHPARFVARLAALAGGAALWTACAAAPGQAGALPVPCLDETASAAAGSARRLHAAQTLMGTTFQIRAVTTNAARGCEAINAAFREVARQEMLFSEYRPDSDISAINRAAGGAPVSVHAEVFMLLQRARWASHATDGAFDVTAAACGRLWSVRERRVPDQTTLASCLALVDYRNLRLDPWRSTAWLPAEGMRVGLGGIAKGYGVDRAAEVLQAAGVTRFVVDGGGDLRVEGTDLEGAWLVQIAHPREAGGIVGAVRLTRGAVVTSGDYVRYFEMDGVRYHHLLDPATGQPARRSVAVTVIAPTATDADALATALFVLGPERGLPLVGRLPGVEALFFDNDLTMSASRGFPLTGGTRQTPRL